MNDLENFNKLERINYFDKEDWEEDSPCELIPLDIHLKFQKKEEIFNKICEDILIEEGIVN
jgi:hypothetical protein